MNIDEFMEEDKEIWELKYVSTSDEEDNDSEEDEEEEEENEDEEEEEKGLPEVAQKLQKQKKRQRVFYSYVQGDGEEGKEGVVVKKRIEPRQPENLIDILVMQKTKLYEKE